MGNDESIFQRIPFHAGKPTMLRPPVPNREEYPFQGSMVYQGIPIYVENKAGSVRSGTDDNGKKWRIKMKHHYGEIPETTGADGDAVDVYVGPLADAPTAYVIHQRHFHGDDHTPSGSYDEDKIMLGFPSREAALKAYAAHFDHAVLTPGVTELSVRELRSRVFDGELDMGAVVKSAPTKPEGAGWMPIPNPRGGKRGWRRRKAKGGYEYDYGETHREHKGKRWVGDGGKTADDLTGGEIVRVPGRNGIFRYVPDHDAPIGAGLTWVLDLSSGAFVRARKETLQPQKVQTKKRRSVKVDAISRKKTPSGSSDAPQRPGVGRAGSWVGPVHGTTEAPPASPEGLEGQQVSDKARKTKVYAGSKAAPGTVLHNLEHGAYMTKKIVPRSGDRARIGVHVPPEDHPRMIKEFGGALHHVTEQVAKTYRIKIVDSHGPTAAYEELRAGASLGMVMALSNYTGGKPFLPILFDYARTYAMRQARTEMGAGAPVSTAMMRMVDGFNAARIRARKHAEHEPSPLEIVKHWTLKKRQMFRGDATELGRYTDGEKVIDQAHEEVPDESWHLRAPDGSEVGKERPGKVKLAEQLNDLVRGGRVEDGTWFQDNPIAVLPSHAAVNMPTGFAYHVRDKLDEILDKLPEQAAQVVKLSFGVDTKDGDPLDAVAVADQLGIAEGKSDVTKRRQVRVIRDNAISYMKQHIARRRSEINDLIDQYLKPMDTSGHKPYAPSQIELATRFGNQERVSIYLAALRAGHADRTAMVLDAENAGTASERASRAIREEYHKHRDQERKAAFKRQTAHTAVGSKQARDIGMGYPSQVPAYDTSQHDYMVAMVKTGSR